MSDYPDRPGYSFDPGPPPEVSRFLRNKGLRDSFSWADVEPEEHAVAFAVAKAAKADVLYDIRSAVEAAIDEGQTFAAFQRDLKPILERKGWWGRQLMGDPLTGDLEAVRLGSPYRLRTIYNANLRAARAAGQWERIERTKKYLPFLEYRLGPSEAHRPSHEEKEGLILPADDPFWDEWMPPNGWGCKCWVRQIGRAEAERRGISDRPDIPNEKWENRRTGEMQLIPAGIDPGWQRNPGKLRRQAIEAVLSEKIEALPEEAAHAALRDIATSWRVRRMATDPAAAGNVPVAILPGDIARTAVTDLRMVHFSNVSRKHLFEAKSDRRSTDLAYMAELREASEILLQTGRGGHPRLIFLLDIGDSEAEDGYDRMPLVVFVVVKPAGLFIDTMHRTDARRWNRIRRRSEVRVLRSM